MSNKRKERKIMKEEDEIQKKLGKDNPFRVPLGYFDNLTKEVMDKLPKKEVARQKNVTMQARTKKWLYAAAMFAGILLSVHYVIRTATQQVSYAGSANADSEMMADEYIETIMDHSMMDDYSLYQYLTETDATIAFE